VAGRRVRLRHIHDPLPTADLNEPEDAGAEVTALRCHVSFTATPRNDATSGLTRTLTLTRRRHSLPALA
jgi:hypothetical protein